MKRIYALLIALSMAIFAGGAMAASDHGHVAAGVGGYDLVSYQTGKRPIRGNGHYVSVHDGVTYLFASEANKKAFDANPQKYLPAFGGWCAYGVSVGKKFYGDPEVWRVVDGKLYLNLDANIQDAWLEDVPGRIKKANSEWRKIRDKSPSEL